MTWQHFLILCFAAVGMGTTLFGVVLVVCFWLVRRGLLKAEKDRWD